MWNYSGNLKMATVKPIINLKEVKGRPFFVGGGLPFGGIYSHDNAVAQTVATATETKVINFDANQDAINVSPDFANNQVVVDKAGKYLAIVTVSFSGTASVDWTFHLRKGATEFDNVHFNRKLGGGGDIGNAGATGIINVAAGDILALYCSHTGGVNKDITIQDCTISILQIGS